MTTVVGENAACSLTLVASVLSTLSEPSVDKEVFSVEDSISLVPSVGVIAVTDELSFADVLASNSRVVDVKSAVFVNKSPTVPFEGVMIDFGVVALIVRESILVPTVENIPNEVKTSFVEVSTLVAASIVVATVEDLPSVSLDIEIPSDATVVTVPSGSPSLIMDVVLVRRRSVANDTIEDASVNLVPANVPSSTNFAPVVVFGRRSVDPVVDSAPALLSLEVVIPVAVASFV